VLKEFGDAEIAGMVVPRTLIISAQGNQTAKPAPTPNRRATRAPGHRDRPSSVAARKETERARSLFSSAPDLASRILWDEGGNGHAKALNSYREFLKMTNGVSLLQNTDIPRSSEFEEARRKRQVKELEAHTQRHVRLYDWTRGGFRNKARGMTPEAWNTAMREHRESVWSDLFGRITEPMLPPNARSRLIEETPKWRCYEVTLKVWVDVFAWGYLLVPKDLKPNERRPVVVCQHGLEGLPEHVIERDEKTRAWRAYKAYGARLADRGFVVYAPHNPYRGGAKFRQLQRKSNPLGLSLYSLILGQHQQTLDWLKERPFVAANRIAFYGLSYGGTTAMRVPPLLEDYCLSICSACFNDWTRKITSSEFRASYMMVHEYEQFSFGLGDKYNHAELAALIAPRPFMVERGHRDGVAPDKWVAHEYAKVRRLYRDLGIPERTRIDWFDGPHTINGKGTFEFLHHHLNWPLPENQ